MLVRLESSARAAVRRATTRAAGPALVGGTIVGLLVAACGSAGTGDPVAPSAGAARLQVINGTRTAVDVLVDGTVRVAALPAASVSPTLGVDVGSRRVELRAAGAAGVTAQVQATASATALVAAQTAVGGTLQAATLTDTAAVPAPGTAKLRVVHMASNAPAIDIFYFYPAASDSAYRWVFPYRYGGSTNYNQRAPGPWEVVIAPATPVEGGAPVLGVRTRAIATGTGTLAAGDVRTVVILDGPNGGVRLQAVGVGTP